MNNTMATKCLLTGGGSSGGGSGSGGRAGTRADVGDQRSDVLSLESLGEETRPEGVNLCSRRMHEWSIKAPKRRTNRRWQP